MQRTSFGGGAVDGFGGLEGVCGAVAVAGVDAASSCLFLGGGVSGVVVRPSADLAARRLECLEDWDMVFRPLLVLRCPLLLLF